MEIVGRSILESFKMKRPDARSSLERWEELVNAAKWRNFTELRRTMASADQVKLDRELVVTIFNIGGNKYRLISEVAYALKVIRVLAIMAHAEYDKGRWKKALIQ